MTEGMMIITFDPNNTDNLVPDGQVEAKAQEIADAKKDVTISQAILVDAIRVLVNQGKLDADDFLFRYKDIDLIVNDYGRIDEWPKGFCDLPTDLLTKLLS